MGLCLIQFPIDRMISRRVGDAAAHVRERRRYPRVKAKLPVELRCTAMAPMRTATDEISLCGCYIETMFTMEVGTKLHLAFSCNENKIEADGIVVTKYPQVGNGIDFINVAPQDRLTLSQYISDCDNDAGH